MGSLETIWASTYAFFLFGIMELTKKDQRQLESEADKFVWKIQAHASEYAKLYEVSYYRYIIKRLEYKIEAIESLSEHIDKMSVSR